MYEDRWDFRSNYITQLEHHRRRGSFQPIKIYLNYLSALENKINITLLTKNTSINPDIYFLYCQQTFRLEDNWIFLIFNLLFRRIFIFRVVGSSAFRFLGVKALYFIIREITNIYIIIFFILFVFASLFFALFCPLIGWSTSIFIHFSAHALIWIMINLLVIQSRLLSFLLLSLLSP